MNNSIRKIAGFKSAGRTPPRQPDYQDELSTKQLEAIRKLAGCDKEDGYSPLFAAAW